LCAQGGPTPQLQRKRFDRAQSWRADVVFHPFHVMIDDLLVKAEEFKKISEKPVPTGDLAGKPFAGSG
jgi:hypothetical protein